MKLLKLQFGGLLSNNDEEGTFTCILEERNDDKRKLFLQLTKTEAEEILLYLRQNKTEEEAMPSEILKFVQSGYNIKNARIATNEDRHVGIVNIKIKKIIKKKYIKNNLFNQINKYIYKKNY